jgi:hypothetical protein
MLLFYYVSLHDKMPGGSGTDGRVRWFRKSLKVMPMTAILLPLPIH